MKESGEISHPESKRVIVSNFHGEQVSAEEAEVIEILERTKNMVLVLSPYIKTEELADKVSLFAVLKVMKCDI